MKNHSFTPENPLVFDGATGSYYVSKFGDEISCEAANIKCPRNILTIHREYLEAGCNAIKTNTFDLSRRVWEGEYESASDIIKSAVRIAYEAVCGYDAEIFADIGPVPSECGEPEKVYIKQAEVFLDCGVSNFLFETLSGDAGIEDAAAFIKKRNKDSFIIVSFAVGSDGVTREGASGGELFDRCSSSPFIDAVGFNCMSGPAHLLSYVASLDLRDKMLSVMPNAGYPTVLGRKIIYQGKSDYFAQKMMQILSAGASIIGGCCGTTPEHIRSVCGLIRSGQRLKSDNQKNKIIADRGEESNSLWKCFSEKKRVIAVELDPPADDRMEEFLLGAKKIYSEGADVITVADCPVGRPRADSSLTACLLKREYGIEPLPHITCRDRNLNATKALLLGLSAQGVHNVLTVTGDPLPTEFRDEVKSVYNFNSRKLAKYIKILNSESFNEPFRVFAALNVNAKNFDVQLKLAKEKEECGVSGFLTQPILSKKAVENLKLAKRELRGKILGGIFPVVSYRNAQFLNNEVAGIYVSDDIVSLYKDKDREECEDIAAQVSVRIAEEIKDFTDGIYLMTPFKRVELIIRIMKEIK